ncbi:hypothetical protein FKW77_007379 [Venturia effusa]|uniref:Uncharacterized protein n=1 Tax=Venturia effusa TaxID=50376 RepID=A0A517KWS7_9PEZI|nr:hypothetical protein FKW77_007379 [Venturia effusa]
MAAQLPNFDIVDTCADGFQTSATNYAQAAHDHATAAQNHANHVTTFVPELKKYRNVAAPDLQQILDRMNTMARDFGARFDTIDNRFDAVENRLDTIDGRLNTLGTKMQAANHNGMARTQNSHLGQDSDTLALLHNWENNAEIDGYPNTVGDIKTMRRRDMEVVLTALGAPVPAALEERREAVRIALGLKPPVSSFL